MELVIKKEIVKIERKTVDVRLENHPFEDTIILKVNGWNVFELKSNGKGRLVGGISSSSGLQLEGNKLVLED